jgi:hypothetical protein
MNRVLPLLKDEVLLNRSESGFNRGRLWQVSCLPLTYPNFAQAVRRSNMLLASGTTVSTRDGKRVLDMLRV